MRTSALLMAVTALLGGCATYVPPQSPPPPAPAPAAVEPVVSAAPPPTAQPPAAPRRPPQPIRIDNTSLDSFRASWERLLASLSPAQQVDLNNAVAQLTFARYGGGTNLPRNLRMSPIVPEMIRDRIHGLTYAEIVALSP